MKTEAPSVIERRALRTFIRERETQDAVKTALQGRKINDLTMADLRTIVAVIGGDATVIANGANDANDTSEATGTSRANDGDNVTNEQLATIKGLIINGGFNAADDTLRKLITDANKPAEIIEVPVSATSDLARTITHAKPTTNEQPWSKLFSVRGEMGKRTSHLWDGAHPETPAKDDGYVWPQPVTGIALSQLARGENVFMWGPPGTGKTAWAMQLAATLGRPFALISCDDQTDAPTLVGMTVPSKDGGTMWQDGVLTRAIQTPGCVVCIDEPSVARAGALMVMQNILAYRALYIAETGRRVKVAKGVLFIACDNTNGTGGGARHGFTGTGRLNDAYLDRFGAFCHFDYLSPGQEAKVIMRRTNCTKELADLLINAATTTRQNANNGTLTSGISLRRLFAWAALLSDGVEARAAFETAVLNRAAEQDREALTQQCLLTYDKQAVARALNPNTPAPENTNTTEAGRNAAEDFQS